MSLANGNVVTEDAAVAQPFGPFLLLDALATGGMGEVWLAAPQGVAVATESVCVLKRVKSALNEDDDTIRRFVDESRISLLLRHSCVCRTIDAGRADGADYLAVELVEGIDIRTLVERAVAANQPVDREMALWIMANAFDGLAYAHSARHPLTGAPLGVVHRDISPHNLMAAKDGVVRVIDFGLALSTVRESRTEQGVVMGKLAYMSPEQARGDVVGAACDIYAAGAVLYELISGERYWGTLSSSEIWGRIGFGTHVPTHFATVDAHTGGVLSYLTAPNPADRITAAQARDALLAHLQFSGGAERARTRLAALVCLVAAPELERMARAIAEASTSTPTLIQYPATRSLAFNEMAALAALLNSSPLTVSMAAPSASTLPPRTAPPSTLAPRSSPPPSSSWPPPTVVSTVQTVTEMAKASVGPPTATELVRTAASPRIVAPPAPPAPRPAPVRRVPAAAIAVAVAVVVAIGIVAAAAFDATRDPVTIVAVTAPTPPVVPPPLDVPPPLPVPPPPSPAVVEPPPPEAPPIVATPGDPLMDTIRRLARCNHPCATVFKTKARTGIRDLSVDGRRFLGQAASNCARFCR